MLKLNGSINKMEINHSKNSILDTEQYKPLNSSEKVFIDESFVFWIFHEQICPGNRSIYKYLCSASHTKNMYKIIKRIKIIYLKYILEDLGLYYIGFLNRGAFGGVFEFRNKFNKEYILKLSGQCNYITKKGKKIPEFYRYPRKNEITSQQKVYYHKFNNLTGNMFVPEVISGILLKIKNGNIEYFTYSSTYFTEYDGEPPEYDILDKNEFRLPILKNSIHDFIIKNRLKGEKYDIIIYIGEKILGDNNKPPITLNHLIVDNEYFKNINNFYKYLIFMRDFIIFTLSVKTIQGRGIHHNDLHASNIIFDINCKNGYYFKVIDFGLAKYGLCDNNDKKYILKHLYSINSGTYFKNFLEQYLLSNGNNYPIDQKNIEEILDDILKYYNLI